MKKLGLILSIFIFIALAAFMITNLIETPLSQNVSRVLYKPMPIPTQSYVNAYMFTLGLQASPDSNPLLVGKQKYKIFEEATKQGEYPSVPEPVLLVSSELQCKKVYECSEDELESFKSQMAETENQTLLKRYEQLMQFGGVASDIEMSLRPEDLRPMTLFRLSHAWFIQLNQLWQEGKKVQSVKLAVEQRRFFLNSMDYNNSLLFYMVSLSVVNDTQNFIAEKMKQDIQPFQSLYGSRPEEVLSLDLDFQTLKDQALESELVLTANTLGSISMMRDFFPEVKQGSFWGFLIQLMDWNNSWFTRLLFDRNDTLNEYFGRVIDQTKDSCLKEEESCSVSTPEYSLIEYLKNPIGKKISQLMYSNVQHTLIKMKSTIKDINSKLK